MERRSRHIAWFLLVLFAMFFCGNTLFIHTHRLFDGHTEVHSHPFMPGTAHSHSDSGFQAISHINAALAAVDRTPLTEIPQVSECRVSTAFLVACSLKIFFTDFRKGRAPPVAA